VFCILVTSADCSQLRDRPNATDVENLTEVNFTEPLEVIPLVQFDETTGEVSDCAICGEWTCVETVGLKEFLRYLDVGRMKSQVAESYLPTQEWAIVDGEVQMTLDDGAQSLGAWLVTQAFDSFPPEEDTTWSEDNDEVECLVDFDGEEFSTIRFIENDQLLQETTGPDGVFFTRVFNRTSNLMEVRPREE